MNRCYINEWCLQNFPRRMFYLNKKKKIKKSCLKHFFNEFMRKVENKMNKHVFVKEKKRFLICDFIRSKNKWFAITVLFGTKQKPKKTGIHNIRHGTTQIKQYHTNLSWMCFRLKSFWINHGFESY